MAGRRPKPRILKMITGNPGKRKLRDDEPEPIPGWPYKPPVLDKNGSAEWDRLAQLLEDEQRLMTADHGSLIGAAKAFEAALQYEKRAKVRGLPNDEWRRQMSGARMQWEAYRKFINDLCLSQGTRARASKPSGGGRGKQTSRLEAFHAKRAATLGKAAGR